MDLFKKIDLTSLLAESAPPCVSVFMPTHRGGSEQDPVRLRNNLTEVRNALVKSGKQPSDVEELLTPVRRLLDDDAYWKNQSDGLALFLGPKYFRAYRLPVAFENLIVVADRYEIAPLLPLLNANGQFYILALSQHAIRLLMGSRDSVSEIDLEGMPQNLEQANLAHEKAKPFSFFGRRTGAGKAPVGIFHGHGVGLDDKKQEILQYFHTIDRDIRKLLHAENTPLILAAVEYLQPIYRQANSYPNLMKTGISGSPEHMTDRELHDRAWQLMKPECEAAQQQAISQYRQMAGTGLTMDALEEIVVAAHEGRVDTLIIPRGRQAWGVAHPEIAKVECHEPAEPGDEDLFNRAAIETLKHGHKVYAIESDQIPSSTGVAAILCHPLAKHGKRP